MSDKPIRVPASYQSDEAPSMRLRDLRADYVGAGRSGFAWDRAALARIGSEEQQRPLRVTLTIEANAEAMRRLSAFFGLYGEGEQFRVRGYLPADRVGPDEPKALPQDVGVIDAEFVDEEGKR